MCVLKKDGRWWKDGRMGFDFRVGMGWRGVCVEERVVVGLDLGMVEVRGWCERWGVCGVWWVWDENLRSTSREKNACPNPSESIR